MLTQPSVVAGKTVSLAANPSAKAVRTVGTSRSARRTQPETVRGKSHPGPLPADAGESQSTRATRQKAKIFMGRQSPHPAAAGFLHSLLRNWGSDAWRENRWRGANTNDSFKWIPHAGHGGPSACGAPTIVCIERNCQCSRRKTRKIVVPEKISSLIAPDDARAAVFSRTPTNCTASPAVNPAALPSLAERSATA
jgi:hypothetical protein